MRVMNAPRCVALLIMLGGTWAALPATPAISDADSPMRPQSGSQLASMDGIKASRATLLIVAQDLSFSANRLRMPPT
jgi:hypothetical protein